VILDALGKTAAAEKTRLALSFELDQIATGADPDQIVGEIQAALHA
jgi:hypothetical protein